MQEQECKYDWYLSYEIKTKGMASLISGQETPKINIT